jgi:uncharacterized Zn finger protein
MSWWSYAPKPTVGEQRARAAREAQRLAKKGAKSGRAPAPVTITGRNIASSFWGKAWCQNIESYRDYEYRLPRGRSYVRNGAVLDLAIVPGRITAVVSGTQLYDVEIHIKRLEKAQWARVKAQCAGQIGSLVELLAGKLSEPVMRRVTDRQQGLFPKPAQIEMTCSCPDWATMCKHVAAVMYGVGARLDQAPELLFTLRQVDHGELIEQAARVEVTRGSKRKTIAREDLSEVFGIELAGSSRPASRGKKTAPKPKRKAAQARRPARKKRARS